jgi:hypothetical protein
MLFLDEWDVEVRAECPIRRCAPKQRAGKDSGPRVKHLADPRGVCEGAYPAAQANSKFSRLRAPANPTF